MKVTKQNDRYITDAIRTVVKDQTADVAYERNSQDELIITIPVSYTHLTLPTIYSV